MRLRLDLCFVGTHYHGWQRQQNALGVQEVVEEALSRLLGEPVEVVGAGRTDTGVHARYYVAHCDVEDALGDFSQLEYKLNRMLPHDVAILQVSEVAADFHARFDALWREYEYVIARRKLPFLNAVSYRYEAPLDFSAMQTCAELLPGWSDFACFCKLGGDNRTTLCRVMCSDWRAEVDCWIYTVRADRFLRGMVRAIVGTMLEVGRGNMSVDAFRELLASGDRSRAGSNADAAGLSLVGVGY